MALFDLPYEELVNYRPQRDEPGDFDAFWRRTLAEVRATTLNPVFSHVDFGLNTVDALDVTFAGYGGQTVHGWMLLPRVRKGPLPCVVQYIGYGGGRGYPIDWLVWSAAGYANLVMDTRGQGSIWQQGDTPDPEPDGSNPQAPGFMTRGILDPRTYYYRRVISDAVRAVETAREHPAVDSNRIVVTGGSQGGGLSLAVSGLISEDLSGVMPDVPFLCHYRRATEITDTMPYHEIAQFCKIHHTQVEQVFRTLSYFDGVNFATRAQVPALFSTAMMDDICPPSTVFAAYNHYAGPKDIRVYPYNQHEGGGSYQVVEQIKFLQQLWV